ncbi:protein kinase MAP3K [Aphelenchoides avenae]|nr:protein kinase MAP3K [Aphelenchus avenae]
MFASAGHLDYDNGILTLVHPIEDVTTKKHRIAIIATTGLLVSSLSVISIIIVYSRVRQYRRRKEWETQEDKLDNVVEIDRGSFGVVSCAQHDGAWVAVKKLVNVHLGNRQRQFENEIWLLKTLGMRYRHPHVVRLLWVVMKPEICIVTELCHGSLYNEIHDYWRDFSPSTILDFCTQIASGMKFLHSKGVIHRDLKSGNVLMADSDGTSLKLCDFGLSVMKSARMRSAFANYFVGSLLWMSQAPEVLAPSINKVTTPYTFESDVYAFGICVYELITSRLPYRGYMEEQVMFQVARGTLQPDYSCVKDGRYFDVLRVISESCIKQNRSARPSFDRVRCMYL